MKDFARFDPQRFSWKRVFLLVAAVQLVLIVTLVVYWRFFRAEFFPYPINEDGTVTVAGGEQPLLVGYGALIPPPWTFTGVGTDTLYLAGMPFEPMLRPDPADVLPMPMSDRLRTVQIMLEEAEAAYQTADGKEDGMRRFAAELEKSLGTVLETVILDVPGELLVCRFVGDLPEITVNFVHEPHWIEPREALRHRQYDAMRVFIEWMAATPDGVFGFGERHIVVSDDPGARAEHLRVLLALRGVSTGMRRVPTPDDVRHALADDALCDKYDGLIQDYLSFRAAGTATR
ncbi:MAG: hypothetical protein Q7W29_04160 [bacterium]|nr:hypothetical protein [bacterium]